MKAFLAGASLAIVMAAVSGWLYEVFEVEAEMFFQGRAANLVLEEASPPD